MVATEVLYCQRLHIGLHTAKLSRTIVGILIRNSSAPCTNPAKNIFLATSKNQTNASSALLVLIFL